MIAFIEPVEHDFVLMRCFNYYLYFIYYCRQNYLIPKL